MSIPATDPVRMWLTHGSLAAGIAFTASAEYDLACTLGATPFVAVMLPLAIDAYVVAALRWFRAADIALSLALMGAAQVAAHLIDSGVMQVNIPMVAVVSLLVPIAVWRTHALARSGEKQSKSAAAPAATLKTAPRPLPTVVPPGARLLPLIARPADGDQEMPPAWAVTVPDDANVLPILPKQPERPKRKELPPAPSKAVAKRPSRKPAPAVAPEADDELLAKARGDFPDGAGVKALKDAYGIGQARAQRIRDQLHDQLNDETTFTVVRDYREEASA